MGFNSGRGLRFGVTQVAIVAVVVLVSAGGAFATGRFVVNSVKQINPKVLKSLRGQPGPGGRTGATGPTGQVGAPGAPGTNGANGANGTNGTNGQGPAIAVTNVGGFSNSSASDSTFHAIATLPIPGAGSYTAAATVEANVSGGSNVGNSLCTLVAHQSSGGVDTTGEAIAGLNNVGSTGIDFATLPVQVTHTFTGPGTITLSCQQNGLFSGGAFFSWFNASIIATQVSAVTSTPVTG